MASATEVLMNAIEKGRIGSVLRPVLSPFHEVDGCPLKGVWETSIDDDLESIQLEFEPGYLNIDVDRTDDTLNIGISRERRQDSECASHRAPWKQQIGKSFGWGWIGVNQQGFLDGVSLSFGSVVPQFSITAIASSLRLTRSFQVHTRESRHKVQRTDR